METLLPAHNWLSMDTSVDNLLSVVHFSVKVTLLPAHNWLSMDTSVDSLLSVVHFSVKVTSPHALYLVSNDPFTIPLSKQDAPLVVKATPLLAVVFKSTLANP